MGGHLPNSERVQAYTRQLSNVSLTENGIVPCLSHCQMRRVRKNANKHGEGFTYAGAFGRVTGAVMGNGYSFLARTPEGLGIFHHFSR